MTEQKGVPEVVMTLVAVVSVFAIVGFSLLFALGIEALTDERRASNDAFQRQLVGLNCVHVGYRGKGEEKVYSCNGRLMQRGSGGLVYSN